MDRSKNTSPNIRPSSSWKILCNFIDRLPKLLLKASSLIDHSGLRWNRMFTLTFTPKSCQVHSPSPFFLFFFFQLRLNPTVSNQLGWTMLSFHILAMKAETSSFFLFGHDGFLGCEPRHHRASEKDIIVMHNHKSITVRAVLLLRKPCVSFLCFFFFSFRCFLFLHAVDDLFYNWIL